MKAKYHIVGENAVSQRLDNFLKKHLKGVPKSRIYRALRHGEVRVNKGRKNVYYKLRSGDVVRIPPLRMSDKTVPKPSSDLTTILQKSILYEDRAILVVNKPTGLAVHGGSRIALGLVEALRQIYPEPLELAHRIDRATSGCVILAKKRTALRFLHREFAGHRVEKNYLGLFKNVWAKKCHTVETPLPGRRKTTMTNTNGKHAISHFRPLQNFHTDDICASYAEISIETGRMHQIRTHARSVGHPLANDERYGDFEFNKKLRTMGLKRLFLHAHKIAFTHPETGRCHKIIAPLPGALSQFLEKLTVEKNDEKNNEKLLKNHEKIIKK